MAMKIRKYGDVLDGAPEMHVDPHNHDSGSKSFRICLNMFAFSQTFPLSMVESTYTN